MNNTYFYIDKKEITPDLLETARYLGYKKSNPPEEKIKSLIEKAGMEMGKVLQPQGVYEIYNLKILENNDGSYNIQFADVNITSKSLGLNLKDCNHIVLMAATIGPQIDAYIRRAQITDSVYASICQATGAMYIEEVVNKLNNEIKNKAYEESKTACPRFSPGYGDVSLAVQKDFFRLLNCSRIGLTLMPSLIMAPEKSVTAFIGLK